MGKRATRRPHLDRPGRSQSNWAGRLSRSPRSSERWSLTEQRQAPPLNRPRPSPVIGRRAWGRGRAGAGGACGGRPRFSLPPSCGCGPGGRAGWAALGFPRRLPRPPWATHTTRGRPPAAPGPAASGGSGGRRSGRQVGAGGGGGAGGEEGLPAAAAAAAAALSRGLSGVSLGGPGIPRTDPTPHMQTDTCTHEYPRAGTRTCSQSTRSHTQHPLRRTAMQTQNHIHTFTPTPSWDPQILSGTPTYVYGLYSHTNTTTRTDSGTIIHVGRVAQHLRHTYVHTGSKLHNHPGPKALIHTQTHSRTHIWSPGFSPHRLKVCRREGETKVKGRSRKPGAGDAAASIWRDRESDWFSGFPPHPHPHRRCLYLSPFPSYPRSPWSLPHLPLSVQPPSWNAALPGVLRDPSACHIPSSKSGGGGRIGKASSSRAGSRNSWFLPAGVAVQGIPASQGVLWRRGCRECLVPSPGESRHGVGAGQ